MFEDFLKEQNASQDKVLGLNLQYVAKIDYST